jgi:hypothetical protein
VQFSKIRKLDSLASQEIYLETFYSLYLQNFIQMPKALKRLLYAYPTKAFCQDEYLVKSDRDKKYSIRSIQEIRKKALKKAKMS